MLDREHIVCAAPGKVAGVLALGVQSVGRDDRVLDVQAVQQRGEQGDLVGLGAHLDLAQHYAVSMVQGRQQVAAAIAAVTGAA